MKRLLMNKKGTAEIIGSIMFIVILLFFFTNVYLWHDAATKEMNDLQVRKINSGMSMTYSYNDEDTVTLSLADNGGSDVVLSRLWVIEDGVSGEHNYVNLDPYDVHVAAGSKIDIEFSFVPPPEIPNPAVSWNRQTGVLTINYQHVILSSGQSVKFVVLNNLGLNAASTYGK